MCARPRNTSDDDLLAATARAISSLGPVRLTLADVAKEAGVVPATLLQRFGSKRGLLLALAKQGSGGAAQMMAALRSENPSPIAAIRAMAECMSHMANTAEELANHLAFLCLDLTDAEFHQLALAHAEGFREGVRALVEEAIKAGEMIPCDAKSLALLIQQFLNGTLITWAIYRKGSAREWNARELDRFLAPYLTRTARNPNHIVKKSGKR